MHAKKEALASCIRPHSTHPPNTSRGMIFSLLKTYYAHSRNNINRVAKMNKLLNNLLERGCNQKKVSDAFKEAELKLMEINKRRRNNKNMSHKISVEGRLEIIKLGNKTNDNRHVNGSTLLCPTFYPKDVSRNKL